MNIDRLIKENNELVEVLDNMDLGNDKTAYSKIQRYTELQNMIKLNERAEKQKNISTIRGFVAKNKEEILSTFNNKCEVCDFSFKPSLIVHHIKPISEGGGNELDNLAVLCPTCHSLVHYYKRNIGEGWEVLVEYNEWVNNNLPQSTSNLIIKLAYDMRGDE